MGWAEASLILNVVLILFSVLQELVHAGDRRDRDMAWTSVRQWHRFHVSKVRRMYRQHQRELQKLMGWTDSLDKTRLYPRGYPPPDPKQPPPLPAQDDPALSTPSGQSEPEP